MEAMDTRQWARAYRRWLPVLGLLAAIVQVPCADASERNGFLAPTRAGAPTSALAGDGKWVELAPPVRAVHSVIYDPVRDRLVLFGGEDGVATHAQVWVLPLTGLRRWRLLHPAGESPAPRSGHVAVYDPLGDRMVVFGGARVASTYSGTFSQPLNDTWALSLGPAPEWSRLGQGGAAPQARYRAGAIYDPVRRRMLVHGGHGSDDAWLRDTWVLDLDGIPIWTEIPARLTWEQERGQPAEGPMVYDPQHDRVIAFSIWGVVSLPLSGEPEWEHFSGLPARDAPVFDPVRRRIFSFASGRVFEMHPQMDEFGWYHGDWWYDVTGATSVPATFRGAASVYDPVRDRILMVGGIEEGRFPVALAWLNAAWALSLGSPLTWSWVSPELGTPGPRQAASAFYDSRRDRMIVVGGGSRREANVVWAVPFAGGETWVPLDEPDTTGAVPAGRLPDVPTVYDPVRDRIIQMHGEQEVWEFPLGGTPSWRRLASQGVGPSSVAGALAVYDPLRDRAVLFGGDTYALELAGTPTWSRLHTGGPSAGATGAMVYDPIRDRLVLHGGHVNGDILDSVWVFPLGDGAGWERIQPAGEPGPRLYGHIAIYDASRDRIVVCGGYGDGSGSDAWELTLGGSPAWRRLATRGAGPGGRPGRSTAIHDPVRDRLVIHGGSSPCLDIGLWALAFGHAPTPVPVSVVETVVERGRVRLRWHLADCDVLPVMIERCARPDTWEPIAEVRAAPGGTVEYQDVPPWPLARVGYRLSLYGLEAAVRGSEAWVDLRGASRFALEGPHPNPSDGQMRVSFTLAERGAVALELFDLGGRRLRGVTTAALDPGRHTVQLVDGERPPPGLYFVRLTQGVQSATVRACVIP